MTIEKLFETQFKYKNKIVTSLPLLESDGLR